MFGSVVNSSHNELMGRLTEDAIQAIERIHSAWIALEVAGDAPGLLAFCAEDIELRPPDGPPILGRDAVLAQLARGIARIHSIEVSDRQLRGSSHDVSLTANYKTTFSLGEDTAPRLITGSHRWELRKQGGQWLIVLVSWSPSATTDS
jgi:ketosteroid isomerase-like protein